MRIMVTGANGFVGKSLCASLRMRGGEVRATMRHSASFTTDKGLDQVAVGDINSETSWNKVLAEVNCVIHLAARVHVMADKACDPLAEFRRVNRDGTVHLAEQAAQNGVRRFIYLSSIKVNGEETLDEPFTADDKPDPLDPYGISKAEAEEELLALAARTGMEIVIIRPPLVYGPKVKANFFKMMQVIAKGIPLPLGAIQNKRSLVFLDNLVDLIITCMDHPAAANQVFLVSDGEDLSTPELLKRLGSSLGKPARLLPVPQTVLEFSLKILGKGDIAQRLCGSLQVDISKARDLLGWQPPVSVDEGLLRTVEGEYNV
ncbi:UDP-glucose 4-epimerase family protein [Desulfobacterota bacterium M19]